MQVIIHRVHGNSNRADCGITTALAKAYGHLWSVKAGDATCIGCKKAA